MVARGDDEIRKRLASIEEKLDVVIDVLSKRMDGVAELLLRHLDEHENV